MERAPSLKGKDLAAAIAATKDFPGVTGLITLDANRDAQKQAVVVQMKGGKPRYVATVVPKGWPEPGAATKDTGSAAGSGSATTGSGSAATGSGSAATGSAAAGSGSAK